MSLMKEFSTVTAKNKLLILSHVKWIKFQVHRSYYIHNRFHINCHKTPTTKEKS